jgi:hypothetical protein
MQSRTRLSAAATARVAARSLGTLALQTSSFIKAHPRKDGMGQRGEDAVFATSMLTQGASHRFEGLGVADGVADWSVKGVDSGACCTRVGSV